MADTLNDTPNSGRIHIGFFGKRNSGKSTLINTLTGHEVSIVSDVAGTTTDPVYKAMELYPLGACVLIDTAGFDDDDEKLGKSRVDKTRLAAEKCDIAVIVFADGDISRETQWLEYFRKRSTPCLALYNSFGKADSDFVSQIEKKLGVGLLVLDAKDEISRDSLRTELARLLPESHGESTLTAGLVKEGDTVLLVMPQDIQAPKGRLILPQVQTLRELLDKKCVTVCVTTDRLEAALSSLKAPPSLIVTDSQVFGYVFQHKPAESRLTSFSVLFAAYKGDLDCYVEGAAAIERLREDSRVLIAECCTHAPLSEDIGRIKLPRLLRKRFGEGLEVEIVSGTDYPSDLTKYDLIIQCGGCMFNRKYILSRIDRAREQKVPITNYGVAIAFLNGILDDIAKP